MNNGKLEAVFFDLHETLVDITGDNLPERQRAAYRILDDVPGIPAFEAFAAAERAARVKLRESTAEPLRDFGVVYRLRTVCQSFVERPIPEETIVRMAEAYTEVWIDSLVAVPDAKDVLGKLKERYRLALVSDFGYSPGIHRTLERFGLAEYFDAVVVSAEVGYSKPHPFMFMTALKALAAKPEKAVMIGDNPACDVDGPLALGIRPIVIDLNNRRPDYKGEKVRTLSELLPILA